jgi:hypothetical protein
MPILIIGDQEYQIPGLGRYKPLEKIGQKRITKAAREVLRANYGRGNITCSCRADVASGIWIGQCNINGRKYFFKIRE